MGYHFPELLQIQKIMDKLSVYGEVRELTKVRHKTKSFPILSIEMGSRDVQAPCLFIVGGVHGLERIGTHMATSALSTVAELLSWDSSFKERLEKTRLIFLPLLNPVGMYLRRRSNGNGVDLMRNAPVYSQDDPQWLYGGHRISPRLPFFRGHLADEMEAENLALFEFFKDRVFPSKRAIALDLHSGFGGKDRLWFPYAKTKTPFPYFVEAYALRDLMNRSYPHNFYSVEPQSLQYTTHGDLWDFLFDFHFTEKTEGQFFLPLTLEMGSWKWVRKNPKQLFNLLGIYNPIMPHRRARVLRDHKSFLDFLHRALLSTDWVQMGRDQRSLHRYEALNLWFEGAASGF